MFGLKYVIFRPTYTANGRISETSIENRNVIGIFINQLLQGEPLTIFGDGEQTRAFSDIKDVAPIIARSTRTRWGPIIRSSM